VTLPVAEAAYLIGMNVLKSVSHIKLAKMYSEPPTQRANYSRTWNRSNKVHGIMLTSELTITWLLH
jgi:hypothetical protein